MSEVNKLNPKFNDFAKTEAAVVEVHNKIEANVAKHGETMGWRGGLIAQFNQAYDDMVITAFHLKLRGVADPVKAASMSRTVERWLPVREKCEMLQHLG